MTTLHQALTDPIAGPIVAQAARYGLAAGIAVVGVIGGCRAVAGWWGRARS